MGQFTPGDKPPRQCHCLRSLRKESHTVDLKKNPDAEKAHYSSLQTCGSVWTCPICASKISEVRKNEVEELLKKTADKTHVFITYTLPHYFGQSCRQVKDQLMGSRRRMKAHRILKTDPTFTPYKKIMDHYHLDGSVTTIEVTWGRNGWHVHSHELLILDDPIPENERARFHEIIFQNWRKACLNSGVEIKDAAAFRRRSVITEFPTGDITERYSSYLAKIEKHTENESWGIAAELTKSHLKKADREHAKRGTVAENLTPMGMLDAMAQDKSLYKILSPVWYEYSQAMKGSRFVFFSKGLKSKYGIQDMTDQDVIENSDILASIYGFFEVGEWKAIKTAKLRGWVIDNSNHPFEILQEKLREKLKNERGKGNEAGAYTYACVA
jgi:hypothetical protein